MKNIKRKRRRRPPSQLLGPASPSARTRPSKPAQATAHARAPNPASCRCRLAPHVSRASPTPARPSDSPAVAATATPRSQPQRHPLPWSPPLLPAKTERGSRGKESQASAPFTTVRASRSPAKPLDGYHAGTGCPTGSRKMHDHCRTPAMAMAEPCPCPLPVPCLADQGSRKRNPHRTHDRVAIP